MANNNIGGASGDINDLAGLPKRVNLGQNKKRLSGQVSAGHAHIEGDMALGKRCITALRSSGEFSRATQGFHAYPARLHPEAARLLLEALPGESLGEVSFRRTSFWPFRRLICRFRRASRVAQAIKVPCEHQDEMDSWHASHSSL